MEGIPDSPVVFRECRTIPLMRHPQSRDAGCAATGNQRAAAKNDTAPALKLRALFLKTAEGSP